ncbi:diacylglycerol kinase family protein [Chengkuizengella sediminis]|uniref:diacylglycerol kinase family protein n=1 Tax=Chengkuizengella sediminis TaxID=1885917 RepID=UPI00138A3467|nr:diacylglycerol kinase family protein [Chengkuizengella sediminis]NDI33715.1 diacylglycerol kinase family protein [Chengkuizengella sediminis]
MNRWLHSFKYAYEGLSYAYSTQKNMRFHFFAGIIVLIFAIYFELPQLEILFVCTVICLVIVMELINTAIEKTIDLTVKDKHPIAKIAKDVAAAAVLVSAVFAVIVGLVVFYNPILIWINGEFVKTHEISRVITLVVLSLVFLCTIVIQQTIFNKKNTTQINLMSALNASALTMVVLSDTNAIHILLTCFISILLVSVLLAQKEIKISSILYGGVLGTILTLFIYFFI